MLARSTAFALADFFQQFDLDLLDFEEAIVLPPQQMIDFLMQVPDLELGFEINLVIILRPQSIARFGAVLAHHDDGCLQCRQAGEDEIKENKREGIERARGEYDPVDDDPDDKDTAERQDESPTSAELRDFVRQMFAKSQLALELLLDVLGQHFVLPQTFDDFVIERREFADFAFERVFNVISAEGAEIREANELLWVPVRPLRFNEFGERRTNVVADGAVLRQERPTTNLAIEFSRRRRFHCPQLRVSRSGCRFNLERTARDFRLS